MNKEKRDIVKKIDNKILAELTKKLEMRKDKINIISEEDIEKIFQKIDERKRAIFLLFKGDFQINEKNISDKMIFYKAQSTIYDKIANNIISKRVEVIFDKMMSLDFQDYETLCIYADRKFFIQRILSENIPESFIEKCIEKDEQAISR